MLMMMKEIGGYFELECGHNPLYHKGVYLNSGRNALRYIIRKLGIRTLHLPYYTCPVVNQAIEAEGCQIERYELDADFMPARDFPQNDFVVYNNYFGVCGKKVSELSARYPNLIVDNAQAFYSRQIGRAAFYSPRKFFGLPDGGIAIFKDEELNVQTLDLDVDSSLDRISHLVKRVELGASAGYADFRAASDMLARVPVRAMSKLTMALFGSVNYEFAAERRQVSFRVLHEQLQSSFSFALADDDVPMVYPYVTDDATLRSRLIEQKIYVAKYWPGLSPAANALAERIVPFPIDQRYGEEDMKRILEVLCG